MSTGFPPNVKTLIDERSDGRCEVCAVGRVSERHHRRPRGMGGSSLGDTNRPSNALATCARCHRLIEDHRVLATLLGWLVPQGVTPAHQPVLRQGEWVYLDDDGFWRAAA